MNELKEEPTKLVPGNITFVPHQSDAAKADAYRKELTAALGPVCDILERGRKDGLVIGWENLGPDQFGRIRVSNIDVTKPL